MEEERPLVPEESSEELEEPLCPIRKRPSMPPPPPPEAPAMCSIRPMVVAVLQQSQDEISNWICSQLDEKKRENVSAKIASYLQKKREPKDAHSIYDREDIEILQLLHGPGGKSIPKWQQDLLDIHEELVRRLKAKQKASRSFRNTRQLLRE